MVGPVVRAKPASAFVAFRDLGEAKVVQNALRLLTEPNCTGRHWQVLGCTSSCGTNRGPLAEINPTTVAVFM